MYNAGSAATSISGETHVALQWRRRRHPLHRKGLDSAAALAKILSDLFKGEEEEFIRIKPRDGFFMYNPPRWVSCYPLLPSFPHSLS